MIPTDAITLTAAIAARAAMAPDTPVMNFLAAGQPSEPLRIGQLHTAALAVAGRLVEAGIVPGDVVLVVAEHDARLVTLFLGALYAGATPSIAPYPSAFSQAKRYQQRLLDMAHVSQARAVLALSDVLASLVSPLAEFGCIVLDGPVFTTPATGQAAAAPFTPLPTAPAYVQFSSGTTGSPKGAVVSQTAALRHLRTLVAGLELTADDVLVGWAPFYHDLGLVIYLLLPLVSGILAVTMAPDYWVRRPQVLLRALHDYRGTVCIMPNFGFAHTTRNVRLRDSEGLDLRCVRHLIAGAEVVQAETLDAFAARFQPSGLAPEALGVGYGMTECVFMATVTPTNQPPRVDHVARQALLTEQRALPSDAPDALPAVSCGFPLPETIIAILDDHGHPLPERQVGEVVITSPTLCDGYLHHPDLTASTLRAGRLYTGDLGYLAAGELFVVDRKKDLIIAAGKHIYPETLEQLALAELGAPGGRAAAFGVRSVELGTEAPVLVCEVRGQAAEADASTLITKIRRRVQQGADVALADVRLVRRGWLEITTSGKVSRSATRIRYLAAGYRPEPPGLALLRAADDDPVLLEQALTALVGGMLGLDTVAPHDSFFALGGDSLTALRFVLAVEEATGRRVPTEFFREPTVAHLVRLLVGDEPAAVESSPPQGHRLQGRQRRLLPARQSLRRQFIDVGPVWHDHALPYGLGVRLQRAWLSLPGLRERLFGHQFQVLRRWSDMVSEPLSEEAIQCSLLANTWRKWRDHVLKAPLGASPWVTLLGSPALWQPQPKSPGTIFLVMHTPLSRVFLQGLAAGGDKVLEVRNEAGGWDTRPQDRALTLHRAYVALQRGETVVIAGDGGKGGQGVLMPFYGGQRLFRQGAAELAVQTGARLVPVFCMMAPNGHVTIEVNAPLVSEDGTDESRATTLTRTYAEMLVARWPQFCPFWEWRNMEVWLDRLARGRV